MVIRITINVPMIFTFIIPVLMGMPMGTPGSLSEVIPVTIANAIP